MYACMTYSLFGREPKYALGLPRLLHFLLVTKCEGNLDECVRQEAMHPGSWQGQQSERMLATPRESVNHREF